MARTQRQGHTDANQFTERERERRAHTVLWLALCWCASSCVTSSSIALCYDDNMLDGMATYVQSFHLAVTNPALERQLLR
eukprot:COSAG06_NODE_4080_length_4593_cov_11.973971_3_plen_80_part_00